MTIHFPFIGDKPGPRYMAIADAIAEAVKSGEFPVGTKLPPQRDLADHLGLTVSTVTRGYALAKQHGYLSGEVGRGTFVQDPRKGASFKFVTVGESTLIDLTCYRPAPSEQEVEIARACSSLARRLTPGMTLRYPPAAGLSSHRRVGADWLARAGVDAAIENVIVCGGAQQAIATLLSAVAAPGDTVLTESLTYSGLRELAGLLRLKLEGVAMDQDGMMPEALDAAAQAGGARLLFLQPNLHNPTTTVMPLRRRMEIVEVARRHNITIIEDDVCGALLIDRPTPLAALAPERTCHITSMSKCVAPSLRVGFLATPPDLRDRVAATHHTLTLAAPPIMAEIAAALVEDGAADRLIDLQRRESARRHAIAVELLADYSFKAHPCGFHIWLSLPQPWRADEFVAAARVRGVAVVSAENFVVGRDSTPHAVRVALTSPPTADMLRKGLQVIAKLLSSYRQSRGSVI